MQDESVNVNQNSSTGVLSIAYKTALKTLAYSLCFITILTAMLSFALPQSANIYFSLGLYGKAISQSERVLSRRENRLNKFYQGGVEFQQYAQDKYLPVLQQTTEYSIKYASVKKNAKNAERALKYITTYKARQDYGKESFTNQINVANVNAVSGKLKVMVYNYESYLNYHYILNALYLGDQRVGEMQLENGYSFTRSIIASQVGELNSGANVYSSGYRPDYAITAFGDYLLTSIEFNYSTNLICVKQSEKVLERSAMFNQQKYSNDMLSRLIVKNGNQYMLTDFHNEIVEMYEAIKLVLEGEVYTPSQPFDPNSTYSIDEMVRLVYYSRVLNQIAYVYSCVYAAAVVYNGPDNVVNADIEYERTARTAFEFWYNEYSQSRFNNYNNLLANY